MLVPPYNLIYHVSSCKLVHWQITLNIKYYNYQIAFSRFVQLLSLALALALMSYSLLDPRALQVIVAMSLGHAFGFGAFGCYLFAVVLDAARARANSALDPKPNSKH